MERPSTGYWTDQLRAVARGDGLPSTVTVPDIPGPLVHHRFYEGYLYPQQAALVAALREAESALTVAELAETLGWMAVDGPDCATVITFLQEPVRERRVIINADDTVALAW
jgi:hypothetical protein